MTITAYDLMVQSTNRTVIINEIREIKTKEDLLRLLKKDWSSSLDFSTQVQVEDMLILRASLFAAQEIDELKAKQRTGWRSGSHLYGKLRVRPENITRTLFYFHAQDKYYGGGLMSPTLKEIYKLLFPKAV